MKKILTIVLTLVLVLGMGTAAVAVDSPTDSTKVTIDKTLTLQGINPEETFSFEIGNGTGKRDGNSIEAPEFETSTFVITVEEGETSGSADINLPDFTEVGVYTYPITEEEGNTAGFGYDTEEKSLVITVINNPKYNSEVENSPKFLRVLTIAGTDEEEPKKVDSFKNSFNAGDLTIKKVIEGDFAVQTDEFTVTVTLTAKEGLDLNADAIKAEGNKTYSQDATTGVVTITYTVSGDSEFTIENVPYNVNYTVAETGYDEYEPTYQVSYDSNQNGEMDTEAITTTITNTRNAEINTGISLDSLPYLIILAVAIGGLILLVTRRRMAANE